MIVVGSCYFLLTLLIPYDPNIDFVFPLSTCLFLVMSACTHRFVYLPNIPFHTSPRGGQLHSLSYHLQPGQGCFFAKRVIPLRVLGATSPLFVFSVVFTWLLFILGLVGYLVWSLSRPSETPGDDTVLVSSFYRKHSQTQLYLIRVCWGHTYEREGRGHAKQLPHVYIYMQTTLMAI